MQKQILTCMLYHSYIPASADAVQCPTCAQIAALTAERDRLAEHCACLASELGAQKSERHGLIGLVRAVCDQGRAICDQIDSAVAERDQLRAALQSVEWGATDGIDARRRCINPACENFKGIGHAADCIVGLALRGEK